MPSSRSSSSSPVQPESPLDVLSRAANMVENKAHTDKPQQDNKDNKNNVCERIPSLKERHPKFRKTSSSYVNQSESAKMRGENQMEVEEEDEGPLDMTIKKPRSHSPPPQPPCYRFNPLRRSSPPRLVDPTLSQLPQPQPMYIVPPPPPYPLLSVRLPPPSYESSMVKGTYSPPKSKFNSELETSKRNIREITIITDSGADPSLDEHFKRSLGANYESLFKKETDEQKTKDKKQVQEDEDKEKEEKKKTDAKVIDPIKAFQEDVDMEGYTVEDHFAKALGETWIQLQKSQSKSSTETKSDSKKTSSEPLISPGNNTSNKTQVVAL